METIKCIETRRSIRKFKAEQVPHEVMQEIVAAASYAPSWKNTQVTRYVVVENAEIKAKIAEEATLGFEHNNGIIKGCAALVVVNMVHGRSGFERDGSYTTSKEDRWEVFDAGLATQTFCLAAHEKETMVHCVDFNRINDRRMQCRTRRRAGFRNCAGVTA